MNYLLKHPKLLQFGIVLIVFFILMSMTGDYSNHLLLRDAFIKKQPYSSWIFDEDTCQWNAPITEPEGTRNIWDELNGVWVKRF